MRIIPLKYKCKHKILKLLWDAYKVNPRKYYTINEISNELSQKEIFIEKLIKELELDKEIYINYDSNPTSYASKKENTNAYLTEKYLKEGWEKFKTELDYWVKICTITVSCLIALFTFIMNVRTTNKNKEDIQLLKLEVQRLQSSLKPVQNQLKILLNPPKKDSIYLNKKP